MQSEVTLKIMEWIMELAGELLSREQVGKNGRAAYFRLYGRNSAKAVLEVGEQMMAKPLRGRKSQKKLPLKERWVFATWVGNGKGELRSAPERFLEDQ